MIVVVVSLYFPTLLLISSQLWMTLKVILRRSSSNSNQPKKLSKKCHHNKALQIKILEEGMSSGSSPGTFCNFCPWSLLLSTQQTAEQFFLWFCPSHQFWLFKTGFPLIKTVSTSSWILHWKVFSRSLCFSCLNK